MSLRYSRRAVAARIGLAASLSVAGGLAAAQDHADAGGTRIPAFVLIDGCPLDGACAGPNSAANPLFVAPAGGEIAANPTLPSTVGDGVVAGGLTSPTIASGGAGYTAGDVGKTVNLVGGTTPTGLPAQVTISAVSGGGVTAATVANPGVYSATPSSPTATTGGGTAGAGLTLYTTFAPIPQTLFGGQPPANGYKVENPNAQGDFWISDDGVAPTANGASSRRVAANGGSAKTEPGEKPPGQPVTLLGATIGAPFIARRW